MTVGKTVEVVGKTVVVVGKTVVMAGGLVAVVQFGCSLVPLVSLTDELDRIPNTGNRKETISNDIIKASETTNTIFFEHKFLCNLIEHSNLILTRNELEIVTKGYFEIDSYG